MTVTGGQRRADVVLPTGVPLVELLPELAHVVGLGDRVADGVPVHLTDVVGAVLDTDLGLGPQGVLDGAVLVLAPVPVSTPSRHDDVADAVAEVVERDVPVWSAAAARRTASAAAGLLLTVGLLATVAWPGRWSWLAAAAAGAALLGLALAADHRGVRSVAVVGTWWGAAHVAGAGVLVVPDVGPGGRFVVAGAGLVLVGLAGSVLLGRRRWSAWAMALVGLLGVAVGGALVAGADHSVATPVALVVLVLAGNAVPAVALGVSGVRAGRRVAEPAAAARLAGDVATGHALLLAGEVALGVGVVALTPWVVLTGPWGLGLAGTAAVVVLLRARHRRGAGQVQAAVTAGVAALTTAAATALLAEPTWRPALTPALAAVGVLLAALPAAPVRPGVRVLRWGEVVETLAVVALLPLLVVTVGWFDLVRG